MYNNQSKIEDMSQSNIVLLKLFETPLHQEPILIVL